MKKALLKTIRILSWLLGGLLALVIVAAVVAVFYLDSIVEKGVAVFGSEMTGTKVELQKVSISLLRPKVVLENFSVANPAGYDNPKAFDLKKLQAAVERNSLFSNKIVIEEILIDGALIDFEPQLNGGNNLSDIKANIAKRTASSGGETAANATAPEDEQPAKKSAKTVLVKLFRMTNCKITITSKLLGGNNITVPLPDIEMTDIGGDHSSPEEVMEKIYNDVFKKIIVTVKDSVTGLKLPDTLDQVDQTSQDVLDKTKKAGGKVIDGIKSLF
ncbi:MAG: AsmA family protein [Victivallales bacterium]|nr:AsmA family protein [Victivallales bacterium]